MSPGRRDVQAQKPESKRKSGKLEEGKEVLWDWTREGRREGVQ